MPGPRAVLMGPPGSGKTTVGTALARVWEVPFRDTDADVENAAGKAISDIFIDDGEQAFRALEHAAVALALHEHAGVLSLGGGAILDPATQTLLEDYAAAGGQVIFLDVSLAKAAPRVGLNNARPLLASNPRQQWRELMEARRPIYERLATLTIDTGALNPRKAAAAIAQHATTAGSQS